MTVNDRAAEIADEFDFLDDWEDRYAHIIDLGKANPPLEATERTEESKVRGCASQVWMIITPQEDDRLEVRAESDAMIVCWFGCFQAPPGPKSPISMRTRFWRKLASKAR